MEFIFACVLLAAVLFIPGKAKNVKYALDEFLPEKLDVYEVDRNFGLKLLWDINVKFCFRVSPAGKSLIRDRLKQVYPSQWEHILEENLP